jgi:hypothetical protein
MPDDREVRPLTPDEVRTLQAAGCTAASWDSVRIPVEGADVSRYRDVRFSGSVRLGAFTREAARPDGFDVPLGVYRAHLHDCTLGSDVRICNIGSYVASVDIGDDAIVENVDLLITESESDFGNDVRARVVNEGGGREVRLFDRLSAQIAYVLAMYRHRPATVAALETLVEEYVAGHVRSRRGSVGAGARVTNNQTLVNLRIGPHARVKGVRRLRNGSVLSCKAAPTFVGDGVLAEDFIIHSGAQVDDGAILDRCFVGQAAKVGKGFSAENCLVFANSELLHGEACAAFCGPHTVSHHKDSLLLTALYSFFNAGSGTNFSNHMYKLGPVHQGLVERGGKTGSFSHVYWPSRIGAFTVVIGRHPHHVDTSALPFSYLIEQDGESLAVPGANLFSIGLHRDARKWRTRDRRTDPDRLDCIDPAVLSPLTIDRMRAGIEMLEELDETTPSTEQLVSLDGVRVARSRLRTGPEAYRLAIDRWIGEAIAAELERGLDDGLSGEALLGLLNEEPAAGTTPWIDAAGLLMPQQRMETILRQIDTGGTETVQEVIDAFRRAHESSSRDALRHAVHVWKEISGTAGTALAAEDLLKLLQRWAEAVRLSGERILHDAKKEFAEPVRVSFGIDGDRPARDADFAMVRGRYGDHPAVGALQEKTADAPRRAARLQRALRGTTVDAEPD